LSKIQGKKQLVLSKIQGKKLPGKVLSFQGKWGIHAVSEEIYAKYELIINLVFLGKIIYNRNYSNRLFRHYGGKSII
jgi:hypothetical protein